MGYSKMVVSLFAVFSVILTPAIAIAQDFDPLSPACVDGSDQVKNSQLCKDAKEESDGRSLVFGENSLMYSILQIIVWVVGVASVIMIIIGGIEYIVSGGDSNGIQSAKNTILYAVVGLVVALFSQVIIVTVLSRFI